MSIQVHSTKRKSWKRKTSHKSLRITNQLMFHPNKVWKDETNLETFSMRRNRERSSKSNFNRSCLCSSCARSHFWSCDIRTFWDQKLVQDEREEAVFSGFILQVVEKECLLSALLLRGAQVYLTYWGEGNVYQMVYQSLNDYGVTA